MKLSKLIIPISAISCFACQNELPEPNFVDDASSEESPFAVSIESALKKADSILKELDQDMPRHNLEDTHSRATISRTVQNIQKISDSPSRLSRAGGDNTTLYLINYEDNKGFALMGADSRLPSFYALSNEGHLNLSDTIFNEGLAIVFQAIQTDISYKLSTSSRTSTSDLTKTVIVTESKVTPWLSNSEVKGWHQNAPFNKYCFTSNGSQALVGCTAVATAQILTYHQYPKQIDGETYYWRSMRKGSDNNGVAKLMAKLGEPAYINMDYGVTSSYAYSKNVAKTFSALGYQHSGLIPYNEDILLTALSKSDRPSGPAYISGVRTTSSGIQSGHAWVIDGFIKQAIYIDETPNNGIDNADTFVGYAPTLIHCIWDGMVNATGTIT